jgi:membrane dipeptidase
MIPEEKGMSPSMDANKMPIFDGHNDTLLHLYLPARGGGRSFFVRSEKGHLDLPRAREAGYSGGFFAIFVPAPGEDPLGPPEPEIQSMPSTLMGLPTA